eukprot:COSAG06_NODE_815_length_12103_cov_4.891458_1_plen_93_part_10
MRYFHCRAKFQFVSGSKNERTTTARVSVEKPPIQLRPSHGLRPFGAPVATPPAAPAETATATNSVSPGEQQASGPDGSRGFAASRKRSSHEGS